MILEKIEKLCSEKGMSVAKLELLAGINKRTMYKWKYAMPAADKLARVAEVLGTTVEELLKE